MVSREVGEGRSGETEGDNGMTIEAFLWTFCVLLGIAMTAMVNYVYRRGYARGYKDGHHEWWCDAVNGTGTEE